MINIRIKTGLATLNGFKVIDQRSITLCHTDLHDLNIPNTDLGERLQDIKAELIGQMYQQYELIGRMVEGKE